LLLLLLILIGIVVNGLDLALDESATILLLIVEFMTLSPELPTSGNLFVDLWA